MGYGHLFAAAFALFAPLIVMQGSWGGNSRGRCRCFQGKLLRHCFSFHLHLSQLSFSCNCIMQSSFPPYPGSWFPTHLSNLASAPFSFPPVPVWPSWPLPSLLVPAVTRWCYFPIKCPPLHCSTVQPLLEGFYGVWFCDGASFGGQLCQVASGLASRHVFSPESVFLKQSCSLWLNQPVPCSTLRSQKGWTPSTQLVSTLFYSKATYCSVKHEQVSFRMSSGFVLLGTPHAVGGFFCSFVGMCCYSKGDLFVCEIAPWKVLLLFLLSSSHLISQLDWYHLICSCFL